MAKVDLAPGSPSLSIALIEGWSNYAIVPSYQGRGYATEAAKAIMEYAVGTGEVAGLVAHTFRVAPHHMP